MIPLRDVIPTRTTPWVVLALVALNTLVFARLITLPAGDPAADAFLFRWGYVAGEPNPTLLTSLFVHTSLVHLAANLLALWIFGENVEDRLGHGRFLMLYLAAGAAGAVVEARIDPASPFPLTGANGAIAGIAGAYLVLFPGSRVLVLVPLIATREVVEVSALFFVCAWFALQLVGGDVHPLGPIRGAPIALHAAGLAAGLVLVHLLRRPSRERVEWWSP